MSNSQHDEALFLSYGQGNIDAFSRLYAKYNASLYRYFLSQTNSKSVAEDLFQEVWQKVIGGVKGYKPTAKFNTWIFTIAHNVLIDYYRHQGVVNAVFDVSKNEIDVEEPTIIEQQLDAVNTERMKQVLMSCLNQLPNIQLEAFLLKEEGGLTSRDIGKVVGSGLEAIKSRLRYAYQNLRGCLSKKLVE